MAIALIKTRFLTIDVFADEHLFVYNRLMSSPLTISPTIARRLAIRAQRLERLPDQPDKEAIFSLIRQLGCLQIDPLNVVARSPLLVLFSRLGEYQTARFRRLDVG